MFMAIPGRSQGVTATASVLVRQWPARLREPIKEDFTMPDRHTAAFRPATRSSAWPTVIVIVVLLGAAFAWWRWSQDKEVPPPPVVSAPSQPDMPAPPPPQTPVAARRAPDAKLPPLKDSDAAITAELNQLLGKKSVGSFLQTD